MNSSGRAVCKSQYKWPSTVDEGQTVTYSFGSVCIKLDDFVVFDVSCGTVMGYITTSVTVYFSLPCGGSVTISDYNSSGIVVADKTVTVNPSPPLTGGTLISNGSILFSEIVCVE
jgi:hypothetical protein